MIHKQLPPPIGTIKINGVSRVVVSLETANNNRLSLLHTAHVRISRAFLCLLFLVALASCSNDDVHFVEISEYYAESCHLDQATQDSIVRFSQKVDAFVTANPEAKEDPLYPRILHNIQTSTFTLNTEWNGENNVTF